MLIDRDFWEFFTDEMGVANSNLLGLQIEAES